jgi:acyl carrier protein
VRISPVFRHLSKKTDSFKGRLLLLGAADFILTASAMGLDSVELLVRFEKYFEVEVPDAVAERLSTPGDVAAWVSQFLDIPTTSDSPSREAVVRRLGLLFAAHRPVADMLLINLLPNGEAWASYAQQLAGQVGWQLPEIGWLRPPRARGWLNQLFDWATSIAPPEPNRYCFTDLVDWTLARNYQQLLFKPWHSQYEVLQAIIGMASDSSGLEVSEIKPSSRFALDLGID